MGIRASATRELVFQDCKVHKSQMLGKEGMGFIVAMKTLDKTRPGIAAQAVGIAQGALNEALKYSREREQFGAKISTFQAIQHMLADMATQTEAARSACIRRRKGDRRGLKGNVKAFRDVQAVRVRHRNEGDHRRGAVVRRIRLHEGISGREDDEGRQDNADIRRAPTRYSATSSRSS